MAFDKDRYMQAKEGFANELRAAVDKYLPNLNPSDMSDALVGFGVSMKISITMTAMRMGLERKIMVAQAADDLLKGAPK
jgi:hypothetical protein